MAFWSNDEQEEKFNSKVEEMSNTLVKNYIKWYGYNRGLQEFKKNLGKDFSAQGKVYPKAFQLAYEKMQNPEALKPIFNEMLTNKQNTFSPKQKIELQDNLNSLGKNELPRELPENKYSSFDKEAPKTLSWQNMLNQPETANIAGDVLNTAFHPSTWKQGVRSTAEDVGGLAGRVSLGAAGLAAGTGIGGTIGTATAGPAGTAVGATVGGLAGEKIGEELGAKGGKVLVSQGFDKLLGGWGAKEGGDGQDSESIARQQFMDKALPNILEPYQAGSSAWESARTNALQSLEQRLTSQRNVEGRNQKDMEMRQQQQNFAQGQTEKNYELNKREQDLKEQAALWTQQQWNDKVKNSSGEFRRQLLQTAATLGVTIGSAYLTGGASAVPGAAATVKSVYDLLKSKKDAPNSQGSLLGLTQYTTPRFAQNF